MERWTLGDNSLPLHAVLIAHKGRIIQEEYFPEYHREMLHRMYSVSKSYTSMAVGALIAQGRLSLEDRIADCFPEYVPENAPAQITQMTIRNMLMMQTCHKFTTYKADFRKNWVGSFFTTMPDHDPGVYFQYDTSSSHTLAALVHKLTGRGVAEYLREVFLDAVGFSKEAYFLRDPFGTEIGGSGLMAHPSDLMKVGLFLLDVLKGEDAAGKYGLIREPYTRAFWERYTAYLQTAMQALTPTAGRMQEADLQQGYGYMFWRARENAAMMYGMCGQFTVLYPDRDLVFVSAAGMPEHGPGTFIILERLHDWVLKESYI